MERQTFALDPVYAHDQNDITCRLLYSPDEMYVVGIIYRQHFNRWIFLFNVGIWDIYVAKLNASTGTCQWLFAEK